VHGETGVERDGLEHVTNHRPREVTADEVELEAGGFTGVDEERSTRDIDHSLHQGLIEGNERVAEARDARFVSERLLDAGSEHDSDVFDRVVHIDVGVARGLHSEVGERVLRECREHVIEERHARLDVALARAVEIEGEFDARLAGGARQLGGT
jgi:hypothetical protein